MSDTKKKKILIIEDEKPILRALELKFSHAGFDVKSVSDGEDALNLLKKETPYPDVILLDLVMPKLDGFTFLKTLKERDQKTPVIVLTNLSQEEDAKKAKALGAADFFIKSNTPIAKIVEHVVKNFV